MHSSVSLAVTVAVITCFAAAAPLIDIEIPEIQGLPTFSVPQVPNPGFKGFHATGAAALAKTYLKYGKQMPVDLARIVQTAAKNGKPICALCYFVQGSNI
jgi:hypothetical protein